MSTIEGDDGLFFVLILQYIVEKEIEDNACNDRNEHGGSAEHIEECRQALGPGAVSGCAVVRQHDGQCQSGASYQGIAQGAFITDDRINAGEHDGSGRDKEYSADNGARNAGKDIRQLGT